MDKQVLFLGGNGHCTARLEPARACLARCVPGETGFLELMEVEYPGFEGRPRAASLEAFLAHVASQVRDRAGRRDGVALYGTGIGGLLALCLRVRGDCPRLPLLLQAPILWGLERRLMPRVMRLGLARLLPWVFLLPAFQARFVRRQFERPLGTAERRAFFAGYAGCAAVADLFHWLTPALLRDLEVRFRARPEALERVSVWWGARDGVVAPAELAVTETALGVRWPLRVFPRWGHYPMIDDPEDWVRELRDALASPGDFPRPVGPQAE